MANRDNTSLSSPNETTVIVIGRQFGSGGRKIGRLVAEKLGYAYYDSELLSKAAERLGFSRHIFDLHDEKPPSAFRSLLQGAFGLADNFHEVSICSERVYSEQSKVIRDLCARENCVIVGRTADYILREHPGLISVFLHAPIAERARLICLRGEAENLEAAIEKAKKFDKDRENYYNFYVGSSKWGKADNYSLSLDSSLADHDTIAEIIINFSKNKQRQR